MASLISDLETIHQPGHGPLSHDSVFTSSPTQSSPEEDDAEPIHVRVAFRTPLPHVTLQTPGVHSDHTLSPKEEKKITSLLFLFSSLSVQHS